MSSEGHCDSLRSCVRTNLQEFFDQLEDSQTTDLHQRILREVEPPLLELTLKQCNGNQSHAAKMLGINRNTLKKKMDLYQIEAR